MPRYPESRQACSEPAATAPRGDRPGPQDGSICLKWRIQKIVTFAEGGRGVWKAALLNTRLKVSCTFLLHLDKLADVGLLTGSAVRRLKEQSGFVLCCHWAMTVRTCHQVRLPDELQAKDKKKAKNKMCANV